MSHFFRDSCFSPLVPAAVTLLSEPFSEEPLYPIDHQRIPVPIWSDKFGFNSKQKQQKKIQPGICSFLNRTYGLLIRLLLVDHSRSVIKQGYNFPHSIASLKSHAYCFLLLGYEKRKLNLTAS